MWKQLKTTLVYGSVFIGCMLYLVSYFFILRSLIEILFRQAVRYILLTSVENITNNGDLTVEEKELSRPLPKQTYADIVKSSKAVELQNELILNGIDPTDQVSKLSLI